MVLYSDEFETAEAVSDFTRALQIDSKDPFAYAGRGLVRARNGGGTPTDIPEIRSDAARALTLAARDVNVLSTVCNTYVDIRDSAAAKDICYKAIALDKTEEGPYENLAQLASERGDHRIAAALYKRALTLHPESLHATESYGIELAYLGHAQGLRYITKAMKMAPSDGL